jgi:hypothetical protein
MQKGTVAGELPPIGGVTTDPSGNLTVTNTSDPVVINPGWETGDMQGWTKLVGDEGGVEATPNFALSGSYYCKLSPNDSNAVKQGRGILQKGFFLTAGMEETVTTHVTCLSANGGRVAARVIFLNASGAEIVGTGAETYKNYNECLTTDTLHPNWTTLKVSFGAYMIPSGAILSGSRSTLT